MEARYHAQDVDLRPAPGGKGDGVGLTTTNFADLLFDVKCEHVTESGVTQGSHVTLKHEW